MSFIGIVITLAGIGWGIYRISSKSRGEVLQRGALRAPLLIVILGLAVAFIGAGMRIVPAGHRYVVFNMLTGVKDNELNEGFNVILPILESTTPYDVRRQEYTCTSIVGEGRIHGPDELWSPTKEGLKVGLDLTVWYMLDPTRCNEIHQRIGPNFEIKVVRPAIRSTTREIIMKYGVMEVIENRDLIEIKLEENIGKMLKEDGILVENVMLRDLKYTTEFAKAIEDKQIAQQQAKQMEFVLEKERKEAERKVIEAEGRKQAIDIVRKALSSDYIRYLYVKGISENDKLRVIVSDQATIMDLKGIMGEEP